MRSEKKVVIVEKRYGELTAKWYWNSKSGKVWKCLCKCGCVCYVKETALLQHVVTDCGCQCSIQSKISKIIHI